MNIPSPIIPKEHGSWAVLLVPLGTSALIAETFSLRFVWLCAASLSIFMSYLPLETLFRTLHRVPVSPPEQRRARFWAGTYLLGGVLSAVPLLVEGLRLLLPIGLLAAVAFAVSYVLGRSRAKRTASDLAAVAGLTLTAPGAYYVLTGRLDEVAFVLWFLHFLFFGSGVVYVHMKIQAKVAGRTNPGWIDNLSTGKLNLIYHLVAISSVGGMAALHMGSVFLLFAFVPMTIHAVLGTFRLAKPVQFKKLGFLLLAHSIAFGVLLSLAFRIGS